MPINIRALIVAAGCLAVFPAAAQTAAPPAAAPTTTADDAPQLDIEKTLGDVGAGWTKQNATGESVTYVCDKDSCGGRGVLGISAAKPSGEYLKKVVADPQGALTAFKYGNEESMKATGCAFKSYDIKKINDARVQIDSAGGCPDGSSAVMSTIFDSKSERLMAVQVLTKGESAALKLRDDSAAKINKALDATL
ncbi:hypothetical protein JOD31_000942 [Methylopila capsulata]|uniref:Uncharacterized protein n=1 Tax=Methylopila capsulata TaxID=61654 RepID=A0A9W6MS80_9HYPH|nr:hypothetical protein [Methylopila capsulata]MBM7850730.1 hypothetical protein [Methylopila capsulata]GLK56023.1 hypothetical protein GCM10008170_20420 [Methylopila capsulata]